MPVGVVMVSTTSSPGCNALAAAATAIGLTAVRASADSRSKATAPAARRLRATAVMRCSSVPRSSARPPSARRHGHPSRSFPLLESDPPMDTYSLYINGAFVASNSPHLRDIIDPANGTVIARVPDADPQDVDAAVSAARAAFDAGPWRTFPPRDRGRLLLELARIILD